MSVHVEDDESSSPAVFCQESRPGRAVFTERGNPDGWIATDDPVDARP
jgi:hypothetical protein